MADFGCYDSLQAHRGCLVLFQGKDGDDDTIRRLGFVTTNSRLNSHIRRQGRARGATSRSSRTMATQAEREARRVEAAQAQQRRQEMAAKRRPQLRDDDMEGDLLEDVLPADVDAPVRREDSTMSIEQLRECCAGPTVPVSVSDFAPAATVPDVNSLVDFPPIKLKQGWLIDLDAKDVNLPEGMMVVTLADLSESAIAAIAGLGGSGGSDGQASAGFVDLLSDAGSEFEIISHGDADDWEHVDGNDDGAGADGGKSATTADSATAPAMSGGENKSEQVENATEAAEETPTSREGGSKPSPYLAALMSGPATAPAPAPAPVAARQAPKPTSQAQTQGQVEARPEEEPELEDDLDRDAEFYSQKGRPRQSRAGRWK